MYTATRLPEAICLRSCTLKVVCQALLKSFTQLGVPLIIRSDHSHSYSLLNNMTCISVLLLFQVKEFIDHNPLSLVHRMKTENQQFLRWYKLDLHHVKLCEFGYLFPVPYSLLNK